MRVRRPIAAALLAGAVLAALAGAAPAQFAAAPAASVFPARYGAVAVDVGPLRARGLGPFADAVEADLAAALRAAFADRLGEGRGGARLVVRVTGVSLNAYAGSDGGASRGSPGGGSGTNTDYLEGEALALDRTGAVIARHPQLSALPASYGGPWYDPASERRRVAGLADHYARWLRRALGD